MHENYKPVSKEDTAKIIFVGVICILALFFLFATIAGKDTPADYKIGTIDNCEVRSKIMEEVGYRITYVKCPNMPPYVKEK